MHFYGLFVDYYKSFLIGKNPLETEKLTLELGGKQNKILGSAGLHTQVLGALIISCWDIKGKGLYCWWILRKKQRTRRITAGVASQCKRVKCNCR
jgi:L-alanine-DL-glutamate epimerase-like enolase superfamily enzyme